MSLERVEMRALNNAQQGVWDASHGLVEPNSTLRWLRQSAKQLDGENWPKT